MGDLGRVAWFHCFAGVAGDMALGALIDAGAPIEDVEATLRRLPIDGWALAAEPVLRGGVAATKVHVRTTTGDGSHSRTWTDVRALLDKAELPDRVRDRSLAVFASLARVEGELHRRSPEDVHFHEVGALDAIVDIVGTCAGLEALDVQSVRCSPIAVGLGTVTAAHGTLPNPAPAVVRLLADAAAPTHGVDVAVELTTPTGAALVATLSDEFGPLPGMMIAGTGFGAGSADPDGMVNATQVVIGSLSPEGAVGTPGAGQPLVVVQANVDDVTGEALSAAVDTLLGAGALDAWVTPVVMKKGRPAHVVSALAEVAAAPRVAERLRASTGSLGVRATAVERWPASRELAAVDVEGHTVRVKISTVRVKAEHDDVVTVAETTGLSVLEVAARAEAAWWSSLPH
jgi:uncharacterized protein (TIGR00299 family) protein